MRQGLESGLSAAEAARIAVEDSRPAVGLLEDVTSRLLLAIRGYDEAGAQAVLDESLAAFGLERVLQEVVLPALAQVGDDWEQGTLDVAQEHFASNVIRGRLLALARLWGRGGGPLALLACAPGERHDISLLAFGLVLRSHGWRILFLGADTPVSTLTEAVAATEPALVVVTSFDAGLLEREVRPLRRLAAAARLILSGPGASEDMCRRIGVERLDGDVVEAANAIGAGA
jgi:methanogenic corrinoid protein MtbC1